jgi:hypothetical protein
MQMIDAAMAVQQLVTIKDKRIVSQIGLEKKFSNIIIIMHAAI